MPEVDNTFEYVFLGDVDPTFKPIDAAFYNLRVVKAEPKTFTYKKGKNVGADGEMLKFQFAVVDDPNFSGRRVFSTLFMSDFTLRALRHLQDYSGVEQVAGEPLKDWLKRLGEESATVKVFVNHREREGANGDKVVDNDVDWKTIQIASA